MQSKNSKKLFLKLMLLVITFLPTSIFAGAAPCCTLTPTGTFATDLQSNSISFSPNGSCVAVANNNADNFNIFSINQNDCILNLLSTFSANRPSQIKFSPNGSCLVVSNSGNSTIDTYSFNQMNCTLSLVGSIITPGAPLDIAFSPDGLCLAAAIVSTGINMYTVNDDCGLTLSSTIASTNPTRIAFSPTGTCIAVLDNFGTTVSTYQANSNNCSLTFISTTAINSSSFGLAFSQNGSCLAVTDVTNNTVIMYSVNDNCTLTLIGTFATELNPIGIAFSPEGSCVAITNMGSNTVSIFTLNSDCSLTLLNSYPTGNIPLAVAFSPNGSCLGVANSGSNNISMFSVIICRPIPIPETLCSIASRELRVTINLPTCNIFNSNRMQFPVLAFPGSLVTVYARNNAGRVFNLGTMQAPANNNPLVNNLSSFTFTSTRSLPRGKYTVFALARICDLVAISKEKIFRIGRGSSSSSSSSH